MSANTQSRNAKSAIADSIVVLVFCAMVLCTSMMAIDQIGVMYYSKSYSFLDTSLLQTEEGWAKIADEDPHLVWDGFFPCTYYIETYGPDARVYETNCATDSSVIERIKALPRAH